MLKWTCDREGNWRLVWRLVSVQDNKLVEVAGATATVKGRMAA